MRGQNTHTDLHARLVNALYLEAMLLADEARAYFDEAGKNERDGLDALGRVAFSCESLKVTTRLMHVIAWLLTQRAVLAGEIPLRDSLAPSRRLGDAPLSDDHLAGRMPPCALALIDASIDLHRRVARIEQARSGPIMPDSPARAMIERLAHAF